MRGGDNRLRKVPQHSINPRTGTASKRGVSIPVWLSSLYHHEKSVLGDLALGSLDNEQTDRRPLQADRVKSCIQAQLTYSNPSQVQQPLLNFSQSRVRRRGT